MLDKVKPYAIIGTSTNNTRQHSMGIFEIVTLSCIFLIMPAFLILAVHVDEKNNQN